MKKKFLLLLMLLLVIVPFSACGKTNIDLNDFLIEERNNLFTASDIMYNATLSTGLRENNYNLDGIVNEKVEFGVLTFARNDNQPMANDTYTYSVKINEENLTGTLEKSPIDNSYVIDLEMIAPEDAEINVEINFTGYKFKQTLENKSCEFTVDKNKAIEIANSELKTNLENITADKNNKLEVVMKLLKDSSNTELNNYFWYVGVITTNGDTLGVLIDANTSNIIAKKV